MLVVFFVTGGGTAGDFLSLLVVVLLQLMFLIAGLLIVGCCWCCAVFTPYLVMLLMVGIRGVRRIFPPTEILMFLVADLLFFCWDCNWKYSDLDMKLIFAQFTVRRYRYVMKTGVQLEIECQSRLGQSNSPTTQSRHQCLGPNIAEYNTGNHQITFHW